MTCLRRSEGIAECNCHVDRIELEGRRAVAVAWRHGKRGRRVRARREIVLSAGAFNSPKLLMLSGIGGGDELKAHGIAVAQDLPGVGANLMDHPLTAIQVTCRQPVSLAGLSRLSLAAKARGALDWIVRRDGLLASNHFECGAFIRSEAGVEFPDLQLYLFPIGVAEGSSDFMREHGFQVQISTQRSRSRGWVRLASPDPDALPRRPACGSTISSRNGISSSFGPAFATPARSWRNRRCGTCTGVRFRRARQ